MVDVICSPLSSQVIQSAQGYYPHLRNLKLADQNTGLEDTEINVLIGADFLWSFMLDSVVRGVYGFGPVALSLALGTCLVAQYLFIIQAFSLRTLQSRTC